ncbi:MAG: hypothetical protein RDV48_25155 [Candidatus Eremiobacteraeota bacterium]|nr:hypothetical protein [Candidatus Eremiobacteraeota bacterium]
MPEVKRLRAARGAALATVLMVVAVALVLVFVLAGVGIFHLNVAKRLENQIHSRNCADAAIQLALEKILTADATGVSVPDVVVVPETLEGATAVLTFSQSEAATRKIPYSTNNISNKDSSVFGWNNTVVPRSGIHLVGAGTCRGVTKTVEAVISAPPFTFCVASSGKFKSEGDFLVASTERGADLSHGLDLNNLGPAHMVANSTADDAISLFGKGKITGDVKTSGNISIDSRAEVQVLGAVRVHEDPYDIPCLDFTKYDPSSRSELQNISSYLSSPTLEGFCKVNDTLNVSGDLGLNGALLYVTGNLNVAGGIKGSGAVVCDGRVTVSRGSDVATDNLAVTLSKGDMTIGGAGSKDYSYFQGVVYTEGSFKAEQVNITGVLICSRPAGTSPSTDKTVTISNSNLIVMPNYVVPDNAPGAGMITTAQLLEATMPRMQPAPPPEITDWFRSGDPSLQKLFTIRENADGTIYYEIWNDTGGASKTISSFTDINCFIEGICTDGTRTPWYHKFPPIPQISAPVRAFAEKYLEGPPAPAYVNLIKKDLCSFVSLKDRMRVIVWREL